MFNKKEIVVKVARVPGKMVEVALNGSRTVSDAIEAAGFAKKDTEDIRVNGQEAEDTKELKDGDRVTLIRNVAGGLV